MLRLKLAHAKKCVIAVNISSHIDDYKIIYVLVEIFLLNSA